MCGPAAQQQLNNIWTFIYSWKEAAGLKTVRPLGLQLWEELGLLPLPSVVQAAAALWTCTAAWCVCVPEPHLKTGNSETAGVVRGGRHRDDEGAVRDVLVVEANGHLVVPCRQDGHRRAKGQHHAREGAARLELHRHGYRASPQKHLQATGLHSRSICPSPPTHSSTHPSICPSVHPPIHPPTNPPSTHPLLHPSVPQVNRMDLSLIPPSTSPGSWTM